MSVMNRKIMTAVGIVLLSVLSGIGASIATNRLLEGNITDYSTAISFEDRDTREAWQHNTRFASSVANCDYPDLTYAAENAVKGVVNIEAIKQTSTNARQLDPFFQLFGLPGGYEQREMRAGGSGVIISEDGYIVTNNHVIDDATTLRVTLHDGRRFDAKIIGTDPATDVALIKIEATELTALPFGSSDELRLGEWVLAIGYPMELQSTITAGIVSAKARSLGALNDKHGIESFIQTDAAVNPGNSGGALVNTRGELVGINTIIKTSTGSYVGYSFAVPETIVRKVVTDLKESGVVQRAVLGISFRAVDQNFIDAMGEVTGIDTIGGMYVASVVENGAASEAGLRMGDVILAVDGIEVNDSAQFLEQIGKRRPADQISLTVRRNGKVSEFRATLQNRSGTTTLLSRDDVDVAAVLGAKLATASEAICRKLDIRGGVEVASVKRGGLLERARVKDGFIITHINDRPIYSLEELERLNDKVTSIDGIYPNGHASSYMFVE